MSSRKHTYAHIFSGLLIGCLVVAYIVFCLLTLKISERSTIDALRKDAMVTAQTQANELRSELQKFLLVPIILRENPDVTDALMNDSARNISKLNKKLKSLTDQTNATYIYVVDKTGRTIASSNYQDDMSFVGYDYQYRPYFIQAMENGQAQYYAKGQTTGRSGLFLSGRISNSDDAMGVIVVKVEFEDVSERWRDPNATSFVVNEDGIILISGDEALSHTTIKDISEDKQAEILEARQFGTTPLTTATVNLSGQPFSKDSQGRKALKSEVEISELNWNLFRLTSVNNAMTSATYRAQLIILIVGLILFALIFTYYRRRAREREKEAVTHLLESEVARQTKELSETNTKLEHEITQREAVNMRFRAAREELAQANRLGSVGAITASVAHELNQPVAAIRTFAENGLKFLERGNADKTSSNLNTIVSLTERIGSISTQLRRYARRGTQKIKFVELRDIFDGVTLLIGELLRSKKITLKIDDKLNQMPPVQAGRVRLEQVFVNLIQNAIDALKDHPSPKVNISIREEARHVEVLFEDNGPGIDTAIASQIFTPFITSKPDGMGIGLGIAKDILMEFGGSIELAPSPILGGAAFLIKLKKYEA